jgi:hypothetical protein
MEGVKAWTRLAKEFANTFPNTRQLSAKRCRERWINHLNPNLIKGNWTVEEDSMIVQS